VNNSIKKDTILLLEVLEVKRMPVNGVAKPSTNIRQMTSMLRPSKL
jgi:hypothetical protein